MDKRFPQYDELDLPKVAEEVLKQWEAEDTFGKSLELRKDDPPFVFYEGPPARPRSLSPPSSSPS